MNRITLFLMGKRGFQVLTYLIDSKCQNLIELVVTSKDANVREDYYYQIVEECKRNYIKCVDKGNQFEISTEYSFAISWRWIINTNKNWQLIVLHDSILPRLRGFNPLVTSLINGDKEIGVTAIFASKEFDKGDVIDSERITINYPIKIQNAIDLISTCYCKIIDRIIQKISTGSDIPAVQQEEQLATYSLWRDDEDYMVDWNQSAKQIFRFINAVGYPYKGARTFSNGKYYIIEDAEEIKDIIIENRLPGKVIFKINDNPVIVCGKGLLKINKLLNPQTYESELPLKRFRNRFK